MSPPDLLPSIEGARDGRRAIVLFAADSLKYVMMESVHKAFVEGSANIIQVGRPKSASRDTTQYHALSHLETRKDSMRRWSLLRITHSTELRRQRPSSWPSSLVWNDVSKREMNANQKTDCFDTSMHEIKTSQAGLRQSCVRSGLRTLSQCL